LALLRVHQREPESVEAFFSREDDMVLRPWWMDGLWVPYQSKVKVL
jgi:hypothetical protein